MAAVPVQITPMAVAENFIKKGLAMIRIDNRAGSAEITPYFTVETKLCRLPYGDFAFIGNGPTGLCEIGIERKTLPDLAAGMTSGRFSGNQFRGLQNTYHKAYLLVEGIFRPAPTNGSLLIHKAGKWQPFTLGNTTYTYRQITGYLNTIEVMSNISILYTGCKTETAKLIISLLSWWSKPWAAHHSHLEAHLPITVPINGHTPLRLVAAQLQGVGWERAKELSTRFTSVVDLCAADESTLRQVPGIGKVGAKRICEQLRTNK